MEKLAFLFAFVLLSLASPSSSEDVITLYGPEDGVVELVDSNVTASIYDSDRVWVVEFYAHWCGHCQRFVPTWIKLAERFRGWSEQVVISAVNCAEQESCADFGIQGTPTVRIFMPGTPQGDQGVDLVAHKDGSAGLALQVMDHIATAQDDGGIQDFPTLKDFEPTSTLDISNLVTANLPKRTAFVLDPAPAPQGTGSNGAVTNPSPGQNRLVTLELGKSDYPSDATVLVGVPYSSTAAFRSFFSGPMFVPSVIVMSDTWGSKDIFFPTVSSGDDTVERQIADYLKGLSAAASATTFRYPETTTTEPPALGDVVGLTTTTPASPPLATGNTDTVYASDLEKAVQYALVSEVPNQPVIDSDKLSALYMFLEVVSKYLPVRTEVRDFVVSLREWPIRMGLTSITSENYQQKVEELEQLYRPFDGTPDDYVGCRGSQPHLRGYPCTLWVSFHTMMTNAAIQGDPAMTFRGPSTVARAMVGYIHHFFSCRHCAKNFALKVQTLGFLPATPKDSMLWLWQIHNMANQKLKGDATEDPSHPKIIWPSEVNCPQCRAGEYQDQGVSIQGHMWSIESLSAYLVSVYRKENVVPNDAAEEAAAGSRVSEEDVADLKALMQETMGRLTGGYADDDGQQQQGRGGKQLSSDPTGAAAVAVSGQQPPSEEEFLPVNLNNLLVINDYCEALIDRLDRNK